MWVLRIIICVTVCVIPAFGQAEWPKANWEKVELQSCPAGSGSSSFRIGKYQVRLVAVPASKTSEAQCRSFLVDPAKRETPLLSDARVSIYEGTGDDLFGDGNPSLILEGYSGGAHCCYTYEIVSLGEQPLILTPIHNETPFFFFKDPASNQYRALTGDGAFDYFDDLCHACAPFPRVVLQVDDSGLHDVSPQFAAQYDSDIAVARSRIADGDIGKFILSDFQDAKAVVLEIVYAYLYSGREEQAWQTLDEMWPAGDRQRIKELIVKTRAKGILSTIGKIHPLPRLGPGGGHL